MDPADLLVVSSPWAMSWPWHCIN